MSRKQQKIAMQGKWSLRSAKKYIAMHTLTQVNMETSIEAMKKRNNGVSEQQQVN